MRSGNRGGIFFRLLFLLFFIGFMALLFVVRHPLMRFAGQFWVVDDPVFQSDALVVLGDDNYAGDRSFHAAELYREGVAPVVVASGRMLRRNSGMAEIMQHDLESFGIPTASIVPLASRAENTREEAAEVTKLLRARGWKRIIIVTSNYHSRRTRYIYGRLLPSSITFRVSSARDSEFDPSHWWQTRLGQKLFFTEIVGYVVAWWELRETPASQNESAVMVLHLNLNRYKSPSKLSISNRFNFRPYLIGNIPRL